MVGQARFHSGCNSKARMNTAEIVVREVQADGGFQVRQLLAERIREPRKSPHRHSHSQVLPLHKRRADLFGVGIAYSDFGYDPEMRGGEYLASGVSNCP